MTIPVSIITVLMLVFLVTQAIDQSCNDDTGDNVVSMPILDNIRATLKADLDVSTINKQLKSYIEKEMEKAVKRAMEEEVQKILDKSLERANETISSTAQRVIQGKGVTYIRWGRKTCPDGTELVYSGQAGGNDHQHKGGGVNYLCLPTDPENGKHLNYGNDQIYGVEYELWDNYKITGWSSEITGNGVKEVPCVVCQRQGRSSVIMIPGRKTCYHGWKSEYDGLLFSDHKTHNSKDFVCVDKSAEPMDNDTSNDNGALFYPVRTACGSLKCPPYSNQASVNCVICTK